MNKLYSILLFATCLTVGSLQAQTCTTFTMTLGDAIQTLNGQMFEGGATTEICGTTGTSPIQAITLAGFEAVESMTIYERRNGTFSQVAMVTTPGPILFLESNTAHSIVLVYATPDDDEDFTLSLGSPGNNAIGTATVMGIELPVSLASFTASSTEKAVSLDWVTASESGNEGFEVQRSANGTNWNSLDFVSAAINGENGATYEFADDQPIPGQSYYRLKQMDFDGKFEFSPVVMIDRVSSEDLLLFPNPASDNINIRFPIGELAVPVSVMDQSGRRVIDRQLTGNDDLDISTLPAGIYVVRVSSETGVITQRFVKK